MKVTITTTVNLPAEFNPQQLNIIKQQAQVFQGMVQAKIPLSDVNTVLTTESKL